MKVLKFGAVWCSGCLIMKPRWAEIEKENLWVKTEYFDFDKDKDMVEKYRVIENLPVFIFLDNNGVEIERLSGEISKDKIIEVLSKNKEK